MPGGDSPAVSVILVVHNEEARIERRLRELNGLVRAMNNKSEMIVVSDGSTDDTVRLAHQCADDSMRVLELPRMGKAAALTYAAANARHPILVFADVRQSWSPDALKNLVANFADRKVGAVGGQVLCERADGVLAGVGLYWRLEMALRRLESRLHSTVGTSGPISAVRRELFWPIPAGTVLDDVYWPLRVTMQGYRVVHDPRAIAYDHWPQTPRGEFWRKVRTQSGLFQLCARLPTALLPW